MLYGIMAPNYRTAVIKYTRYCFRVIVFLFDFGLSAHDDETNILAFVILFYPMRYLYIVTIVSFRHLPAQKINSEYHVSIKIIFMQSTNFHLDRYVF